MPFVQSQHVTIVQFTLEWRSDWREEWMTPAPVLAFIVPTWFDASHEMKKCGKRLRHDYIVLLVKGLFAITFRTNVYAS